jgi:hypothetical protein
MLEMTVLHDSIIALHYAAVFVHDGPSDQVNFYVIQPIVAGSSRLRPSAAATSRIILPVNI